MKTKPTITEARDGLETAIIMALMMDRHRAVTTGKALIKVGRQYYEEKGLDKFCPPESAYPRAAYAFDAVASERLYTNDLDQIVVDPIVAIGSRLEIMVVCEDGTLKWKCIKPMPRPHGLTVMSNEPCRWFAIHYRTFHPDGRQTYVRRPIAITQSGDVARLKILGTWQGFDPTEDRAKVREQLAISLSVFEDAHRINAFLATVEEHVKLMFPVGADGYKSFLAMRDGYRSTPTGHRNPILHWCAEHLRQRNGVVTLVEEHLRGAEEFVIGPMRLSIEPTTGYEALAPIGRN